MIFLLQITVSENDQICFSSCVWDKDIFMNPLVFLNIKSTSLMRANIFYLFLVASQWWRVIISTKQKSPEFLAQSWINPNYVSVEETLIMSALNVVLVFWELPSGSSASILQLQYRCRWSLYESNLVSTTLCPIGSKFLQYDFRKISS